MNKSMSVVVSAGIALAMLASHAIAATSPDLSHHHLHKAHVAKHYKHHKHYRHHSYVHRIRTVDPVLFMAIASASRRTPAIHSIATIISMAGAATIYITEIFAAVRNRLIGCVGERRASAENSTHY